MENRDALVTRTSQPGHRLTKEEVKALAQMIEDVGAEKERARLRPLLERCEDCLEGYSFHFAGENERSEVLTLLADLRREMVLPDHQ